MSPTQRLNNTTRRRAFTLIELLTVLAITSVLLTVIVVPVYSSFNLTRSAQAFADAQARARVVADKISREIGNAVSVRSTSQLVSTTLNGGPAQVTASSMIVVVPAQGAATSSTAGTVEVVLPYTKLDLIPPAEGDATQMPGNYINPITGFFDPTLQSRKGQPMLPAGPGATMIRYFIGLHDPNRAYNNPYDGILMQMGGGRDNLYVLYRAEVKPYIFRNGQGSNGDTSIALRPNPEFFQSDPVTDKQIVDLDDPRFFLNDNAANIGIGNTKASRLAAWQSKATLMSDLSRYDMIQPIYNKFTHAVTYVGTAPQIVPLIQFRPEHVTNDPAQGQVAVRPGEEANNGALVGPDVYKTQYGLWSNQVVRVWPQGWNPNNANTDQYFVGRNDPSNGSVGAPPGYSVYFYDPASGPNDYNTGLEVFDMYTYELAQATGARFPFSQAVLVADGRSHWLQNAQARAEFVPFDMNSAKGKVITSFEASEVGDSTVAPDPSDPQNLPMVLTSPAGTTALTPKQDPNTPGNFYDPAYATINEKFNKVYNDNPGLQPNVDRFIDLRRATAPDLFASPLDPLTGFPKARIVPGSEVVYGPDQLPGPNNGQTIRYVRVTRNPGPNQYRINYVDQPEPTNPTTHLIDYTMLGLTPTQIGTFNPAVYDPTNFVSAVIQPRYKKGYIQFNSDPDTALPTGAIQVDYRFQFNGTAPNPGGVNAASSDVVGVDYDTRQLMSVLLTIRNYPQTTNIPNPQMVTVKATAALRNVIR